MDVFSASLYVGPLDPRTLCDRDRFLIEKTTDEDLHLVNELLALEREIRDREVEALERLLGDLAWTAENELGAQVGTDVDAIVAAWQTGWIEPR